MKKLTTLFAIIFMISGLFAQRVQMSPKKQLKSAVQTDEIFSFPGQNAQEIKANKKKFKAQQSIWKPEKTTLLFYEEGNWVDLAIIQNTYDSKGNILTEDDGDNLYTYTYNENNKITSGVKQEHGPNGELINVSKKTYQYDPIVTNLVIDQQYIDAISATEWGEPNYHHKREIVRDSKGKVLSTTVLLKGEDNTFTPLEKIEAVYDEISGMAKTWKFSSFDSKTNGLKEKERLEKIKWENTDDQFVYLMSTLMIGNNRIRTADHYLDGEKYGKVKGVYNTSTPKSPDFEFTIIADDSSEIEYNKFIITDEFGSYSEIYQVTIEGELANDTYMQATMDQFGNMISEEFFSNMDTPHELVDGIKNEIVYHTDTDKPGTIKQLTSSMLDYELGDFTLAEREVYDNFVKITISSILTDSQKPVLNCYVQNNSLHFTIGNKAQYTIFSINGAVLQKGTLAEGNHSISLNSLTNGMYFLHVKEGDNTYASKFLKQ